VDNRRRDLQQAHKCPSSKLIRTREAVSISTCKSDSLTDSGGARVAVKIRVGVRFRMMVKAIG
jgi:hypothetical protein